MNSLIIEILKLKSETAPPELFSPNKKPIINERYSIAKIIILFSLLE
jgi:hypothetical protein